MDIASPEDSVTLGQRGTVDLAAFLLSAAGINLVGAARKVVEADQATMSESEEPAAPGLARVKAIRALAAELARLDGMRT